jgi:hypothetical protein
LDSRIRRVEVMDDQMTEVLRSKTEAERLAMIDQFWRLASRMIRAMIVHEHPDWSEEKIRQELARRMSHGAV